MADYAKIAKDARLKVLDMIYEAQSSHIGSNFSAIDIMAVLFEKIDLDRDRFILSAGWKAAALYYFLWRKGRITEDELNSYCKEGSKFIGLAEPIHPDIPVAGGSMGLGLPMAVGIALAKKLSNEDGEVYVLMSDGEIQCGTTWEAINIANQHNLGNLTIIVDKNGLQAMGRTDDILEIRNAEIVLPGYMVNGHDYEALSMCLMEESRPHNQKPRVIWAKTVKGMGVPAWEDDNMWHYKAPNKDEYEYAKACLTS